MQELSVHGWLVATEFLLAPVVFVLLLFVVAPYGRHERPGWGPALPNRLGWLLMESPAVVAFIAIYWTGDLRHRPVPLLFLGLWTFHYVYRSWIYPFRVPSSGRRIPVVVVLSGFSFNCLNAYINARWVSHLGPYGNGSMADAWLWGGVTIFALGWLLNQHSDKHLLELKREKTDGYQVPRRGAFRWVSCPNYLGEIIEWIGWAVATRSLAGLAFAVFTFANLAPRALSHHRWYRERFRDYPRGRKALIPYVL